MPAPDPVRLAGAVADAFLEATVVGSWTRVGCATRRRWCSWEPAPGSSMSGRVALVTSGTRGIGRATATALAAAGASVGIVGRDRPRTEQAAADIGAELEAGRAPGRSRPGHVWGETADLGSVAAVESLATRVASRVTRLDALVHGAGLLSRDYARSPDGTELTAAVHVVGPHLLTTRMAPLLAAAPSTVVWVSSGGMYAVPLEVERLDQPADGYRPALAYARAKRAQVVLAHQWNARLSGAGVSCFAMHPGWVDTGALRHGLPAFAAAAAPLLRTAEQGADTVIWLASGAAGPGRPPALWLGPAAGWASWNAHLPPYASRLSTVTYWMNRLQGLAAAHPLCVTLNREHEIDPATVLGQWTYAHPVLDAATVAAQRRRDELQGRRRTWYCGAYWGYGFHEDGVASAADVCRALGVAAA